MAVNECGVEWAKGSDGFGDVVERVREMRSN